MQTRSTLLVLALALAGAGCTSLTQPDEVLVIKDSPKRDGDDAEQPLPQQPGAAAPGRPAAQQPNPAAQPNPQGPTPGPGVAPNGALRPIVPPSPKQGCGPE